MAKICTTCGATIEDGERFCLACGTPVEIKKIAKERFCPQCGNLLKPDAIFCDVCGRETERPKKKEENEEPEEPAEMEGLISPTITEDTFAGSKELRNQKFDGFESAEDHAVRKPDEEALKPKAEAMFEMDAAALPELKKKPEPKPEPVKIKKEVTPESIKNSNPYDQFAAKAGGKTIRTAAEGAPAQATAPQQQAAPAPAPAPSAPKKSGFAAFIEKLKGLFGKK